MIAFLALFAFGTVWFWIIASVLFLGLIVAVEEKASRWVGALSALLLLYAYHLWHGHVFSFIAQHPGRAIAYALGYIGVGVIWAVIKWYFFLSKSRQYLLKHRENLVRGQYASGLKYANYDSFDAKATVAERVTLQDLLRRHSSYKPSAASHKSDITFWMTYWPFSFVGSLITDFITNIFEQVYLRIAKAFQSMSDKMFSDLA
jgi:hypothetical protein